LLLNCFFVEEFLLEAPNQYGFLSNGNLQIQGINDAEEYSDTMVCCDWLRYHVIPCISVVKEAMSIMGMTDDEIAGMYVVCGMCMYQDCITCT